MEETSLVIHTDGGSRGNPGPAACAFVVSQNNEIIFRGSKYLAKATNNVAEYSGVIIALEWLIISNDKFPPHKGAQAITNVQFVLDSELVVKQLNGIYKVKDENLQKLFLEVKSLMSKTGKKIIFKHVLRNNNKDADLLVNLELDRHSA